MAPTSRLVVVSCHLSLLPAKTSTLWTPHEESKRQSVVSYRPAVAPHEGSPWQPFGVTSGGR